MDYEEILEHLSTLRFLGEKGNYILLSTEDLKALDYAMMAVKSLEDMPETIADLLRKE